MKKVLFMAFLCIFISCSTIKESSSSLQKDQFFVTRRYIGDFIEYSHTGPKVVGGVDLIWIKTTIYRTFGKISAYGRQCNFSVGDKIYLKMTNSAPGNIGDWEYQIENDSSINYRLSEFRFENNVFTRTRSLYGNLSY
ncbi:MAG: hypothetical protein WA816_05670 [Bacteroidales bacterium]